MTHELKTWPQYFKEIVAGKKTFEYRKNDRGFQVGHFLRLREWSWLKEKYTGNEITVSVEYLLEGNNEVGLPVTHCIMSIKKVKEG